VVVDLAGRRRGNAHFGDHYRPAEYRSDSKKQEDALSGNGGVFESEKQTAGR
jgi:hypothetical protein